jgi:DhnA family fructose-bisphosphate aldolase class Ia
VVPPLTIVVVPQEVMCAPGVVDSVERKCNDIGSYYRLREKTLLVVDTEDRAALEARLAEGLGEVACLYNEITPCFVPELQAAFKQR